MLKKILLISLLTVAATQIYKKIEIKLLKDEKYLLNIIKKRRTSQNNEILKATLSEAKRLVKSGDFDSAVEYYLYAYGALGCDWDYLLENVENDRVKQILESKKENK